MIHPDHSTPRPMHHILLVDDSHEFANLFERLMMRLGHDVRTVHDGVQGVKTVLEFRPDVVFIDIDLPEPDGFEIARRIRDEPLGKDVSLIALTAFGVVIDERRFHEAGFDDHFAKPVNVEALFKAIGRPLSPPA